jgi:hypothetical protein
MPYSKPDHFPFQPPSRPGRLHFVAVISDLQACSAAGGFQQKRIEGCARGRYNPSVQGARL